MVVNGFIKKVKGKNTTLLPRNVRSGSKIASKKERSVNQSYIEKCNASKPASKARC